MGLAYIDNKNKIRISDFGNYFLQEEYDLGEVFFRSFLKWQLPNPDTTDYKIDDGYNIKPFVATLHLINEVNKVCLEKSSKQKDISHLEFKLFGLTLFDYKTIQTQAEILYQFRIKYEKLKIEKENLVENFITKNLSHIDGIKNLQDYADNAIRYFRLTRYIYLRGSVWYIDLEPRRSVELNSIFEVDNASAIDFCDKKEYRNYLCDISRPVLPWENEKVLRKIVASLSTDIDEYQQFLEEKQISFSKIIIKDFQKLNYDELKTYIQELRNYRKTLQRIEIHFNSQQIADIEKYVSDLKYIFKSENKKPIELERLCSLALNALNDAIETKPNYLVGDDNEPTFTVPPNKPDIKCFYKTFNAICEVTMLKNRQQWYSEGQPVMRHLRNFENASNKKSYCLFIAPNLHRDTINTYWNSVKYEYEGTKQKIVPLTINQFLIIRKQKGTQIYHHEIKLLFDQIIDITTKVKTSDQWISVIPQTIDEWQIKIAS